MDELMVEVPRKWERLGDLVLVPSDSFRAPEWAALGQALWTAVSAALSTDRLAQQAPVANTGWPPLPAWCMSDLERLSDMYDTHLRTSGEMP